MNSKILYASNNPGKLLEAQQFAALAGVSLISPRQIGSSAPQVVEDSGTYLGNARLKAQAFLTWSGLPSLADDAGLEVTSLPGELGVETAYYAGPHATARQNNEKLLERLAQADGEARGARFVCQLVVVYPDGSDVCATGEIRGRIATSMFGSGGFGYDCVFIPEGSEKTLAEMKERGEFVETHRSRALRALFEKLAE